MAAHGIALFTVIVWGLTFVSTKVLLVSFSPLWILFLRFALGLLALVALRPRILRLHRRRHEWLFVAAGATGLAGYYLLENVALVFTSATRVGLIVAASPLFTALLAAALGDTSRLRSRFFLGFLVAMAGIALVSFGGGEGAGADAFALSATTFAQGGPALFGDGLALVAALVWAVYSLLVQRISQEGYETIAATKRIFFWGVAFIVPIALLFGGSPPSIAVVLDVVNGANLLFLGLVASAACFVSWGIAVKRLGPVTSSAYIYLVPAITAAASILILGEPFTLAIGMGIPLTIVGLLLSMT